MTDNDILKQALAIHEQNKIKEKLDKAIADLREVDIAENQAQTLWSIQQTKLADSLAEYERISVAKNDFLVHRDIDKFREDIKPKKQ